MHRNINHRFTAVAIASVALLSGAGGAAADTPSATLQLEAGPIGSTVDSESLRHQVSQDIDAAQRQLARRMAEVQQSLETTRDQLRATQQRLSIELYRTNQRARGEIRGLRERVNRLRIRVNRLQAQTSLLSRRAQRMAIDRANSAVGGAWVVVDSTGNVLNQSGGARVTYNGTGNYSVQFDTSRSGCASLSSRGPSMASSGIQVSPTGSGNFAVRVTRDGRPRDGGFYLAVSC